MSTKHKTVFLFIAAGRETLSFHSYHQSPDQLQGSVLHRASPAVTSPIRSDPHRVQATDHTQKQMSACRRLGHKSPKLG